MGYDDVGKLAKRRGCTHPKHIRKIDPESPRATPAAKPRKKAEKPFGYSYEFHWGWWSKAHSNWERLYHWFETETARDQSLRAMQRKMTTSDLYRDLRAERQGCEP
jgi:hypothetical protein